MSTVTLAETLFSSVARLSLDEKGRVLDLVSKLMTNPSHPGLNMERVERAPGAGLWSARISRDLRAILYRDGDLLSVLYAGHHDDAYGWAARRKVERHLLTGALQIVESPERVEERLAAALPPTPTTLDSPQPLFAAYTDEYLLSLGIPEDWLGVVRRFTDIEMLLDAADSLPAEAAERLFDLATGAKVTPAERITANQPVLQNPDSRRRFFVVEDEEELARMLDAPLATWMGFLHPSQRRLAEGSFRGPLKITGTAGTGKTVVAMHRARVLARQGRRVLLTSYTNALCDNIGRGLDMLCNAEERGRITVETVHGYALHILRRAGERVRPPQRDEIKNLIELFRRQTGSRFSLASLHAEWEQVVQAQGITTWEEYRVASRAGRGTALGARERREIWDVFERVLELCERRNLLDWPALCGRARAVVERETAGPRALRREAVQRCETAGAEIEQLEHRLQELAAHIERARAEQTALDTELARLEEQGERVRRLFRALDRERRTFERRWQALQAQRSALLHRRERLAAEEQEVRAAHSAAACRYEAAQRELHELDRGLTAHLPEAVIVDEVQDLGPQELRLLAAIAGEGPDRLTIIGDGGQRIYARRFSLRALGIDVRGRSHTLRINYRTTEQIRRFADALVSETGDDLDGGAEPRRNCRSLIRGPDPVSRGFATAADEYDFIAERILCCQDEGRTLDEIAVFARTNGMLDVIKGALGVRGILSRKLSQPADGQPAVSLGTMHGAKGLEFKVVFVAGIAEGVIPLPAALADLDDPTDIEDALTRERQLLYVCMTRARDEVFVTWSGEPSRFLQEALTRPAQAPHRG